MNCSLGISNFLEEISSLSHSVVFLFLCIDRWRRLSYLSLPFFGSLHSNVYLSFSPLAFTSLLFSAIWPHKRLTQTCLWVSVSLLEVLFGGGLLQGQGTECSSAHTGPFEGGGHFLHYLYHSLVSSQTTGREHSPAHQQKIGFKFTEPGPAKKAEHQRIDAFELWCWRRLLWVPWTVRRSNQSILKEKSPGCSLEGLMLKLKL